jgi:N-acetylglucosaminyldiphosphoundecaprenol N-acetyl-beta-D-mannosaminyltransferase
MFAREALKSVLAAPIPRWRASGRFVIATAQADGRLRATQASNKAERSGLDYYSGDCMTDQGTQPPAAARFQRILGIEFFCGTARQTIDRMKHGGLLVVPAAPALKDLPDDVNYRDALLNADLAITDSAFMVLIWNFMSRNRVPRVSGLEYLKQLLLEPDVREPGNTLWIMASPKSARINTDWLRSKSILIRPEDIYLAPIYNGEISDEPLLAKMRTHRYKHVIVTVGGGTQERLGLYMKRNLHYLPAIHCIGAAIAFLSGDQVNIPVWADKSGLGWLLRCLSKPSAYVPRYWAARKLVWLMLKYKSELPPLVAEVAEAEAA